MEVALHASIERHRGTKRRRVDPKQFKEYREAQKDYLMLLQKDPKKMPGFSGGAVIDTRSARKGLLSDGGKRLVDFWKSNRQRR